MDITFAEPEDVPEVTPDNCANSSDISFQYVYYTNITSSAEPLFSSKSSWMATIPLAVAVTMAMMI